MVNGDVRDRAKRIIQANPSLSYAEIGRQLGVSRERIRQVAATRRRYPRLCRVCRKSIRLLQNGVTQTAYRRRYCYNCWVAEKERRRKARQVAFTCEMCGATFSRKWGVVKRQVKLGQRVRWCSRRCHGKWLATYYEPKGASRN